MTGDASPGDLYTPAGGLRRDAYLRRIMTLAGHELRTGTPGPDDLIAVWGHRPSAKTGEALAETTGAGLLRVEDAFLRSVLPGRVDGSKPLGLLLDQRGVHYDASQPSDLEVLLATHPLDDTALLNRARAAIARMGHMRLSKYAGFDDGLEAPAPGYVLVVDQTRDDAAITFGGASAATFREMLVFAQTEHPDAQIIIKTHPETAAGAREGHFSSKDETNRVKLLTAPISPWKLFDHARAVYTVSSNLGFEAIFGGHKPRVFGQPFYSGWGLTQDENPVARRERRLTRAQLFAAAMILYPTWYDPFRNRLTDLETVMEILQAQTQAWRMDHPGYVAHGFRRWKHGPTRRTLGARTGITFKSNPGDALATATTAERHLISWASAMPEALPTQAASHGVTAWRVEDGFLRSRGLGADLIPPLSLVMDDLGIYYDPSQPSRLEQLIRRSNALPESEIDRATRLQKRLFKGGLSKYNTGQPARTVEAPGRRILVVGQVEDDASVQLGCPKVSTNLDLLKAARARHPDAHLIYKPHPDVEAGLRPGKIAAADLAVLADTTLSDTDPATALATCDAVWTLTSLLGFEALLRGLPVTCLGVPFYAGWGLTHDHVATPERRGAHVTLAGLIHATLIGYPRYFDPKTGAPCPVEVVVDHLESGDMASSPPSLKLLAFLQRRFARFAPLWR